METYDNIRAFLASINMSIYADAFEAADITTDILSILTDNDLKEIGVSSLGHRRKLLSFFSSSLKNDIPIVTPDTPGWIENIPTILAVGIDEYFKEQDPVLRLWHICDIAELTLRLLSISGLSELRYQSVNGGPPFSSEFISQIKLRLELPTLGKWQGIATLIATRLDKNSPSSKLVSIIQEHLIPLLDGRSGEGREWSLRHLRNQLAHGGGITKARAKVLVEKWKTRFDSFISVLESTDEMRLIVRTSEGLGQLCGVTPIAKKFQTLDSNVIENIEKAFHSDYDIVLVGNNYCFGLWPLSLYAVSFEDGKQTNTASPQVYVRRGEVGLIYTPIGSSEASQNTIGDEAIAAFEKMMQSDAIFENKSSGKFKIPGFETQLERESQNLVGRSNELEVVERWISENRSQFGIILGGAGTGKSLLMARICLELKEKNIQYNGLSNLLIFRFKGGDNRSNRESFLIFISERIGGLLNRFVGDGVPPVTLVVSLIKELSGLFIVIDGLDEIAERDSEFIKEIILPIKNAGARILCASRPELFVTGVLKQIGAEEIFENSLPLMSEGDIRTMILERTGPLRRIFLARDFDKGDEVKNDAIESIIKSASGLPLYVNYVIGDLLSKRISLDGLVQLPPTLSAYHARLLQRGQIGDLAFVSTPLMAALCIALEPLSINELCEFLIFWGILSSDENPRNLVNQGLKSVESMIRQAPDPSGEIGYLPYHHSLRQFVLDSSEMRHSVKRAKIIFTLMAMHEAKQETNTALREYFIRQGAQHLSADGAPADTVDFVKSMSNLCGPVERQQNINALNESLRKNLALDKINPKSLFEILLELHDGLDIAIGARVLYLYHCDFLTSVDAEPLELGFAVTYELAAEIARIEYERNDSGAIDLLQSWVANHECPAQYVACYALTYLFMLTPHRLSGKFLITLSKSNPYDRMVVLNALMYRSLEGISPFQWVSDGPFWNSSWPYLSRDASLVRACYLYAENQPQCEDQEVEEIRRHLNVIDNLAKNLIERSAIKADSDLSQLIQRHWFLVSDLSKLRRMRTQLVLNSEWLDLGKLLLSNPFWQIASVGAEILAERYHTNPADQHTIDKLLDTCEPFHGAGLLGDRDIGIVDLARLTLNDDKDPHHIISRIGPFLKSPSSHQRAESALHLTQLFHTLPDEIAPIFLNELNKVLVEIDKEVDIWALHELVELYKAINVRGFKIPESLSLKNSSILNSIINWQDIDYIAFSDIADSLFEIPGVR